MENYWLVMVNNVNSEYENGTAITLWQTITRVWNITI